MLGGPWDMTFLTTTWLAWRALWLRLRSRRTGCHILYLFKFCGTARLGCGVASCVQSNLII